MVPLSFATRMARGPRARTGEGDAAKTEADREARLAEMMSDAHTFSADRVHRVATHRAAVVAEEQAPRAAGFLG